MTIVHNVKDRLPTEGEIVFADNGKYSHDRAVYTNGEFIVPADFPVGSYKMNYVSKWFYLDEYEANMKLLGKNGYPIGFTEAEKMPYNPALLK